MCNAVYYDFDFKSVTSKLILKKYIVQGYMFSVMKCNWIFCRDNFQSKKYTYEYLHIHF